jgi:hypothetical protein
MTIHGGGLFDFLRRVNSPEEKDRKKSKDLNNRINKLLIDIDYCEGVYSNNKSRDNLIKWLKNLQEINTIVDDSLQNYNINKNSLGTEAILDKIKIRNNKMGEILIKAAVSNNELDINQIITYLPILVNYTGRNKVTALLIVARHGNTKLINMLLRAGADKNAIMAGKLTPLHQAVISGKKDAVKALINAGANNSVVNDRGHTARNLAKHGTIYNNVPSDFKKIRPLNNGNSNLTRRAMNTETLNNNTRTLVRSFKRSRNGMNNDFSRTKKARTNLGPSSRPPLYSPQERTNVSRGIGFGARRGVAPNSNRSNRFKKLEERFKALRAPVASASNNNKTRSNRIKKIGNRFNALRRPSASARRQLPPGMNSVNNLHEVLHGSRMARAEGTTEAELNAELAEMTASNTSTSGRLSNKNQREVNDEIANLNRIWSQRNV